MNVNLMSVNAALRQSELCGKSRSHAIAEMSNKLNVTIPTLYRWINSDDHFICSGEGPGTVKLFKMVKELEVS